MKSRVELCLALAVCGIAAGAPQDAARALTSMPLHFEPAPGASGGEFLGRGFAFQSRFFGNQMIVQAGHDSVRLEFEGAAPHPRIEGISRLRSTTNIFRGNDPTKWRVGIPNYGKLRVRDIYRGIDLVYYGNAHELEYDLIVKPGADPTGIRLRFHGGSPYIDRDGSLVAGLLQRRPVAYQVFSGGSRTPVESHYRKNVDGSFGFSLGHYDHEREVVIDPSLVYSRYLAGTSQDFANAIGHDAQGFIYVAGTTDSGDFPLFPASGNPAYPSITGDFDLFLAKIDPNAAAGSEIVYLTYFGGSGAETLNDMAVTPRGNVYLTGSTASTDFPLANAAQAALSGTSDAFVLWLDPSQAGTAALQYSTFLGGGSDDVGNGIAVDSRGRIFIAGNTKSGDFPLVNNFQGPGGSTQHAFIAGIDPSQSNQATLIYSTYIGGSGIDQANSIAAAPDGTFWVAGGTFSSDFPIVGNSYQPVYQASGDAFVAQVNPSLGSSSLIYATFLAGSGEEAAKKTIIDAAGRLIVTGYTTSPDFPITPNAIQASFGGNTDAFVTILNPAAATRDGQLIYSTYFGGSDGDAGYDIKEDAAGNLYVTGYTSSLDLPVTATALQPAHNGGFDAFALKFNPSKPGPGAVAYSSYLASDGVQVGYGVDFDANGNIYVVGYTTGPLFDPLGGAGRVTGGGMADAFVIGVNPR